GVLVRMERAARRGFAPTAAGARRRRARALGSAARARAERRRPDDPADDERGGDRNEDDASSHRVHSLHLLPSTRANRRALRGGCDGREKRLRPRSQDRHSRLTAHSDERLVASTGTATKGAKDVQRPNPRDRERDRGERRSPQRPPSLGEGHDRRAGASESRSSTSSSTPREGTSMSSPRRLPLVEERITRRGSLAKLGGVLAALAAGGWKVHTSEGAGPAAVASGAVRCVLTPEQTE